MRTCQPACRQTARHTVALIEAGGPRPLRRGFTFPVGYFKTIRNPRLNWMYRTEADPGLNGRAINWPRGKTLGGSSSINGLLYVRGQPQDYDGWRQLGNVGWSWDDVLPLFRRAEAWEGGEDTWRGGAGPLTVSRSGKSWSVVDAWIKAAEACGFPYNEDYNGASQEGVGYFQLTARNGLRCSSAKAYLSGIKSRPNLHIITHALAAGLIFDGKRASGVRVLRNGEEQVITARREVILSSGAIGSAATPDAVRHRRPRPTVEPRHRSPPSLPGRRSQPARPPASPPGLQNP